MSKQLYKSLLEDFKKSNKSRKSKLAAKYGYSSTKSYQSYLESMIQSTEDVEILTDIVIAFDTTGSMSSYIEAVKLHVKSLIPKFFKENPNLKLSVVAFGDYCDMISKNNFGNAYQVINLTNDENELINFINNAKNTSGGDIDEFYEVVLHKIRTETLWRNGSNKSILLIGDYNPHKADYKYYDLELGIDWRQEAKLLLKEDIKVDTLQILDGIDWYRELSEITNGVNLLFNNSGRTNDLVHVYNLARGGKVTKASFVSGMTAAMESGDAELTNIYKTYSKHIID